MAEVKKVGDGQVEVVVKVDEEVWKKAQNKAFNKLAKKVTVRGFRQGQAPKHLVAQHLNTQSVLLEAAEEVAQEEFRQVLKEHEEIELIDRASFDIDTLNENEAIFKFTCPVKPDVKLNQYKGFGLKAKRAVVKNEEIEKEIERLRKSKAELEVKEDGSVEDGDIVVIDYRGLKDGEAFEGGSAENYSLKIGSKTFIPGFEEQLIGMKAEEEKTIEVTFPEDYHAEELKGQKVNFEVKVHEIKKEVLPEVDEEFVEDLDYKDVKTVDELRDHVKKQIADRLKRENENELNKQIFDKLYENAEVNIPDVMVEDEVTNMINEMKNTLMNQGISVEQFYTLTGQREQDLRNNYREEASRRVKINLILEAIAKEEKVEVSANDLEKEYKEIAKDYNMPIDDIKKYIAERDLKQNIKMKKALEIAKS